MLRDEGACLARLRQSFLHTEFMSLLGMKKDRMEELATLRGSIKPIADRWVVERRELGATHSGVEAQLERIRVAFEQLSLVEAELEQLASDYLRKLSQNNSGTIQDRIALYRSWGG
ncbi:MAG: hypothetical protein RL318_1018 [Fibrobacterota bacterium]